jgi:hypothetical protein
MRFGDGDARMLWTWILKLVVDGLTELRKLECRCKSGLVAGRLRTPRPTRLQPNQIGRVERTGEDRPCLRHEKGQLQSLDFRRLATLFQSHRIHKTIESDRVSQYSY